MTRMMTPTTRRLAAIATTCAALLAGSPLHAHEVQHEIRAVEATSVRLAYSDGEPFAYENYEIYADDNPTPIQTGRTDATGHAVFTPIGAEHFRLRAFSADGHGVELTLPGRGASATGANDVSAKGSLSVGAGLSRNTRLLIGLAVIAVLFIVAQLFVRRRRPNA